MREIKFRAWSKSENLMGEVTGFRFSKSQYPFVNARFRKNGKTVDEGYHFGQEDGCDSVILMQFTGLYDKNGVEIYEGDIVHAISRMDCANMVVVWDNAKFVLVLCERLKTYTPGIGHKDLLWLDKEIIGNIYDNPELLEVTP